MGSAYPELIERQDFIRRIIETEEKSFERTLDKGLSLFDEAAAQAKSAGKKLIDGATVFKLYDTYGFPVDLTNQLAEEQGFELDKAGFDSEMKTQKERARAASKFRDMASASSEWAVISEGASSVFTGYSSLEENCTVRRMRKTTQGFDLILDKTPFYAESGGQCGDTGLIYLGDAGTVEVVDTIKEGVDIVHIGRVASEIDFTSVSSASARVDEKRRADIRRNHTATHILQYSLRRVLGDHVKQSGSMNNADRLRFDFTHFQGLTEEELSAVERAANEMVLSNLPVQTAVSSMKEAESKGALALFGEKYGDSVRVVSVGAESIELCGGIHVPATGEIGYIHIVFEASVSAGIRRVEAITGRSFGEFFRTQQPIVKSLCRTFKVPFERLPEQVTLQGDRIKNLEKECSALKAKIALGNIDEVIASAVTVNGVLVTREFLPECDRASLEVKGSAIIAKIGSGVALIFAGVEGKGAILAAVSDDLIKERKLNAGSIVKVLSEAAGGRGGGRANLAQGGAKDIDSLKAVYDNLDTTLSGLIK